MKTIVCLICRKVKSVDISWVGEECRQCFEEKLYSDLLEIAYEN